MKSKLNLTRFTYETTAFQGWRLCKNIDGHSFTKYYGEKKYGGVKKAFNQAESDLQWLDKSIKEMPRNKDGKIGKREANSIIKQLKSRSLV